jgi:WD40 repeat protein
VGQPLSSVTGPPHFSADGSRLLTVNGRNAQLWDLASAKPVGDPLSHEYPIGVVAFSPDGTMLLTGSETERHGSVSASTDNTLTEIKGQVRLWDSTTGEAITAPIQLQGVVHALVFNPDGKSFLTASSKAVRSGKVERKRSEITFGKEQEWYEYYMQSRVELWELATWKPTGPSLQIQDLVIDHVAFSPDGSRFLTSGITKTEVGEPIRSETRLWNARTLKPIGPKLTGRGVLSPDGKAVLVTIPHSAEARLWDTVTWKPISLPFVPSLAQSSPLQHMEFSPDGSMAVTAHGTSVRLWDIATGKPLGPPLEHSGTIVKAAFSPDGARLLNAGGKIARLWQVPIPPVQADVERIKVWLQVITGMELDENGVIHRLDAEIWHQRHQRLVELGGPPTP